MSNELVTHSSLITHYSSFLLLKLERPGNIESEKDIAILPLVLCIGKEGSFIHSP